MSADLVIRPAEPSDTDDILELMKLSLGEGNIPRRDAYWRWKHVDNPFGTSPSLLAHAGTQLVGLRVFMRWMWQVSGREVSAVRAVDTATHPSFQGRGIFSRLTLALVEKMRAEGVAFVFNTPNEKSRPGYLKMGWVNVGRTSLWVRPIVRGLLGGRQEERALATPASELFADAGLARFCAALPGREERFSTRPTPEYLRWRYAQNPGVEYRAAWSLDGEEGALVIFRRKDEGKVKELRLCQLLVGRGKRSRQLGGELLRSLLGRSSAHCATVMTTLGSASQRVLTAAGFVPAPRLGPIMTVRPLAGAPGAPDPLRRSAWDLSIGDLELF